MWAQAMWMEKGTCKSPLHIHAKAHVKLSCVLWQNGLITLGEDKTINLCFKFNQIWPFFLPHNALEGCSWLFMLWISWVTFHASITLHHNIPHHTNQYATLLHGHVPNCIVGKVFVVANAMTLASFVSHSRGRQKDCKKSTISLVNWHLISTVHYLVYTSFNIHICCQTNRSTGNGELSYLGRRHGETIR